MIYLVHVNILNTYFKPIDPWLKISELNFLVVVFTCFEPSCELCTQHIMPLVSLLEGKKDKGSFISFQFKMNGMQDQPSSNESQTQ